jgi:hypothetical protein
LVLSGIDAIKNDPRLNFFEKIIAVPIFSPGFGFQVLVNTIVLFVILGMVGGGVMLVANFIGTGDVSNDCPRSELMAWSRRTNPLA